jgi:IclR family KDG regulon transcriptional repressor
LSLLAKEKRALGISEISHALDLNKSTVFSIVYTLVDLHVLENRDNKFRFGPTLYLLGKSAENGSNLIQTIHPFLEEITEKTNLSSFLGIRSGPKAIILDKVDSPYDLKISSEIGLRIPLLAGAGGKALLSQLSDDDLDEILSTNPLRRFTPFSCVNKKKFKEMIGKVRKEGLASDYEEYIEGIRALAIPLNLNRKDMQSAIWVAGLKAQVEDKVIPHYSKILLNVGEKIENLVSF